MSMHQRVDNGDRQAVSYPGPRPYHVTMRPDQRIEAVEWCYQNIPDLIGGDHSWDCVLLPEHGGQGRYRFEFCRQDDAAWFEMVWQDHDGSR